jgi:hypothetical protein
MTHPSRTFKVIGSLLTAMTIILVIIIIVIGTSGSDDHSLSEDERISTEIQHGRETEAVFQQTMVQLNNNTSTAWKIYLDATGTAIQQYNLTATAQSTPAPH